MTKSTETQFNDIAVARYDVIAPLITARGNYSSDAEFFRTASNIAHNFNGKKIKVSASTIERWYYAYQKNGFNGLIPQRRQDLGTMRKISADVIDFVTTQLIAFPRVPATQIHAEVQKQFGGNTSLSTINRLVNKIRREKVTSIKDEMLRYERAHINEVWCGDSTVIWANKLDKNPVKLYIIALIDDASRRIVGAQVFYNDNAINLTKTLKTSVLKFGIPDVFNFDNGRNYKCKQMEVIAGKIGSRIHYCAPYSPTAKAKIERWFRTLKDHRTANECKKIEEIQASLNEYVIKYNSTIHSSLKGMTPIDRFNSELNIVRYLEESKKNEAFLFEIDRKASIDGVIKVEGIEYETGYKYQGQRVRIVYEPGLEHVYIKDENGLTEIFELDKISNSKSSRTKLTEIKKELTNND